MINKSEKRIFFRTVLMLMILVLIAGVFIFHPFKTFGQKETSTSSDSTYVIEDGIESSKKFDETELSKETVRIKRELAPMAGGSIDTEITLNGLKYVLWSDGKAGVKGFYGSSQTRVTIPATVTNLGKTYEVVHIYANAFKDNTVIKSLSFANGNSFEGIEGYAFQYCTNLESVDFSNCKYLSFIGEEAFAGSGKLSNLKFPTESSLTKIGFNAFRNCNGLVGSVLKIPDSVKTIEREAFYFDTQNYFYKEIHHKKVASVKGSLPNLETIPVELPEEANNYESKVDSSTEKTLLHKAAKWTNTDRTTAEIRLDYGSNFDRLAKLDVIFVMDYSGSMTIPTNATDEKGVTHFYPRGFLTDDIVYDASKILVDNQPPGYDNRVAMVAFDGRDSPLYKSEGYINNSENVKKFLIEHPNYTPGGTNYAGGLQGAINILDTYPSNGRIPIVIFLSDGIPNGDAGISKAKLLRNRGVNVYPFAIYTDGTATDALKAISHDEKTVYVADDTKAFEKVMMEVLNDVINHNEPLKIQIEDVLSDKFELLTGTDNDFELSPDGGKVTINKQKLTWDLANSKQGVTHTLKIKVKLKPGTELTASGALKSNDSMGAIDGSIKSMEQPVLERYLAHHRFESSTDSNMKLPEEVMNLLPGTTGGYGKGQSVKASEIDTTKVKTKDGRTWEFIGWDANNKTIVNGDITFIGKWKFSGYDFSFIKMNDEGKGLTGAEFSLYAWSGIGNPTDNDLVNQESIASGKWQILDTQTSQDNGRVDFYVSALEGKYFQLMETKAPDNHVLPTGQWRFTLDANGYIENNSLIGVGGLNGSLPPQFEVIQEGEFKGFLGIKNEVATGQLPSTGGLGLTGSLMKAMILFSFGIIFSGLYMHINKMER